LPQCLGLVHAGLGRRDSKSRAGYAPIADHSCRNAGQWCVWVCSSIFDLLRSISTRPAQMRTPARSVRGGDDGRFVDAGR
jgi:hypothetical protein